MAQHYNTATSQNSSNPDITAQNGAAPSPIPFIRTGHMTWSANHEREPRGVPAVPRTWGRDPHPALRQRGAAEDAAAGAFHGNHRINNQLLGIADRKLFSLQRVL